MKTRKFIKLYATIDAIIWLMELYDSPTPNVQQPPILVSIACAIFFI